MLEELALLRLLVEQSFVEGGPGVVHEVLAAVLMVNIGHVDVFD